MVCVWGGIRRRHNRRNKRHFARQSHAETFAGGCPDIGQDKRYRPSKTTTTTATTVTPAPKQHDRDVHPASLAGRADDQLEPGVEFSELVVASTAVGDDLDPVEALLDVWARRGEELLAGLDSERGVEEFDRPEAPPQKAPQKPPKSPKNNSGTCSNLAHNDDGRGVKSKRRRVDRWRGRVAKHKHTPAFGAQARA